MLQQREISRGWGWRGGAGEVGVGLVEGHILGGRGWHKQDIIRLCIFTHKNIISVKLKVKIL